MPFKHSEPILNPRSPLFSDSYMHVFVIVKSKSTPTLYQFYNLTNYRCHVKELVNGLLYHHQLILFSEASGKLER